ncbi:hypothetical protein M0802_013403 [Mischocyttarus mexicanus]|nr:hypothetical protein M0802_013403 [Mischocyttarus mexicanus]
MAAEIVLQKTRASTIASIIADIKDISTMDLAIVEKTRDLLKATWARFDAENERILSSCRETAMDLPYFKTERYEATMRSYLAGISILNQSFTDWRPFEDLFSSLVKDNPDISQVEKMHYLRSSLEGDAGKVISNLKLSADAFEAAWKRLVGRLDNKRLLALAQVKTQLELPPVKPMTSHGLHQIVNIVESSLSAIEALGCPVEQWGPIVLQRASSSLDVRTRKEWEHHLGASTEIPPYQRLLSFISASARALEHIESHKDHEKQISSRTSRAQRPSPTRSYAKVLNLGPQTSQRPDAAVLSRLLPSVRQSQSEGQGGGRNGSEAVLQLPRKAQCSAVPKHEEVQHLWGAAPHAYPPRTPRHLNQATGISGAVEVVESNLKHYDVIPEAAFIIQHALIVRCPVSSAISSEVPAKKSSPQQSSPHHKSSPPSSSHRSPSRSSSNTKATSHQGVGRTSQYPRSHLKSILKSSISSLSKSSLSSSSKSSQKVNRVRFSSPISDCDRSSHSSLSSCSRALVLLATCKAFAISNKGVPTLIRLLIDPGSEITLVSSKLVAKLNLKRHPGSIPIQGVGTTSPGATQGQESLILQSTYSSSQVNLKALILPKITSQVPSSAISEPNWPHLRPLRLAEPDFLTPNHIDILIGADNLRWVMKSSRLIMAGDSEPIAFHTRFGWAVLDATSSPHQSNSPISCYVISNKSLNETLTKFWVQEEDSSCPTPSLSLAESECEKHFVDTHSRLPTAMDLATAEETPSFLKATWEKFDAGNETIHQSSRETAIEHPYFKEGRNLRQGHKSKYNLGHLYPTSTCQNSQGPSLTIEDLFSSMVKNNPDISQVEKMHYLHSILEGEAAKVFTNLKLSADPFKIAWKRLAARAAVISTASTEAADISTASQAADILTATSHAEDISRAIAALYPGPLQQLLLLQVAALSCLLPPVQQHQPEGQSGGCSGSKTVLQFHREAQCSTVPEHEEVQHLWRAASYAHPSRAPHQLNQAKGISGAVKVVESQRCHLRSCHHHPERPHCQMLLLISHLVGSLLKKGHLTNSHLILDNPPHPLPHHLEPLLPTKSHLHRRLLAKNHLHRRLLITSHLHLRHLIIHPLVPLLTPKPPHIEMYGWAVLGATFSPHQSNFPISFHAISNESLNDTLTKFWVQEEVSACSTSSLTRRVHQIHRRVLLKMARNLWTLISTSLC